MYTVPSEKKQREALRREGSMYAALSPFSPLALSLYISLYMSTHVYQESSLLYSCMYIQGESDIDTYEFFSK